MAGAKVDLTQGSIPKHVLRMLGPFAIAIVALMSAGLVDTWYLGNLTDEARPDLGVWALAAVGIAFPLTFLGNSANIGLGAGTMSAISRAIGQDEMGRARRHAASAIVFALLVMTGLVTIMYLGMPFMLEFYNDNDPAVIVMARDYLVISFPGLVIVSIAMMCNNVLRAGGEAALPSAIMILGAIINIILDPFLIYGIGPFPRMEVQGAALATVLGNSIAAIFGLYLTVILRKAIDFKEFSLRSFRNAVKVIGAVGVPAMGTNIIVPIATAIGVAIISQNLTTVDVAAFTLTMRLEIISVGLLYALSACIGAITGQNGGAGLTDRVRSTFKACYWISFIWGTMIALVLTLIGPWLVGQFNSDPELIAKATPYFYIVPITVFAYGFVFVSAAGLNALGRPKFGLIYTIIRSLILYIALVYIGVKLDGIRGAFIGIAAANLISGFIAMGWTLKKAPMIAVKS
ncbi:MAG: MATE family efflux transporter [Hellea sp.]|nr:MATE family efflux transporter [Hellea sp.]